MNPDSTTSIATQSSIAHTLFDRERGALRRAGVQAMAGAVALMACLGAIVLLGLGIGLPPDFDGRGRVELIVVVLVGWSWLLRRAPAQWRRISADLRAGEAATLEGAVRVEHARGFGLFAPSHTMVVVAHQRFSAPGIDVSAFTPGEVVGLRYAPRSRVLLSLVAPAAESRAADASASLTPRDRSLLEMLARGLPDKVIARQLGLTPATVRTYNSALFHRLGAVNRQDAVFRARQAGLLNVD